MTLKKQMLSLYDEIQCYLGPGKGRASAAIIAPNILECFGSLDEGNFICRILNVYRELFTLLGDARVNRFHIWAASRSLLLAIFSMRPIVHCGASSSMCTMFHKECVECQTSFKTGSAHFSTFPNIPATMPGLYCREIPRSQMFQNTFWQLIRSYVGHLVFCNINLFFCIRYCVKKVYLTCRRLHYILCYS